MGDARIWPAESGDSVTPSDTTTFEPTRALYIGTTGNIKVQMVAGDVLTFNSIVAGILHPLSVVRVYNTDTTASNILALR